MMAPAMTASRVARQYDVNASQVFSWRRRYREEPAAPPAPSTPQLVPVSISAEPEGSGTVSQACPIAVAETIEIEVSGTYRIRSAAALTAERCGACSMCWVTPQACGRKSDDPCSAVSLRRAPPCRVQALHRVLLLMLIG